MNRRPPRVVIVGGGPAAAGSALTLADAGVPALVVDRSTVLRDKPGECLTADFRPLLARLRLLDLLQEHRRIPAFASRWALGVRVERPLIADPHGEGWLLDRRRFEARLIAAASARGARWQLGWTVESLTREGEEWQVALIHARERRTVIADFVIDATGRTARLTRELGARYRAGSPGCFGAGSSAGRYTRDRLLGSWVVARGRACDGPVRVEVDADGWWYAAALRDGRTSIVWFSDRGTTNAAELLGRAREHGTIAAMLADDDAPSVASVHAAGSDRAGHFCGPGWFAVGDAAVSFDPLSSYGIGSALGTGFYAAQALLAQWSGNADAPTAYEELLARRWQIYLVELAERYAVWHPFHEGSFWRERRRRVQALLAADLNPEASPDRGAPALRETNGQPAATEALVVSPR